MSTNHTPNYSLSQWQVSDQVLRTDFNEDNAKIDAALNLSFRRELIMEVTAQEDVSQLEADVSDLDWGAYQLVLVHFKHAIDKSLSVDVRLIDQNGVSIITNTPNTTQYSGGVMLREDMQYHIRILFLSLARRNNPIRAYSLAGYTPVYHTASYSLSLEDIKKIQISTPTGDNYFFEPGSSLRIFGIK